MPAHKFVIGQKARFRIDIGELANRDETFAIARQLPETGGMPQYEIRSEADGHARVVREDQLADL